MSLSERGNSTEEGQAAAVSSALLERTRDGLVRWDLTNAVDTFSCRTRVARISISLTSNSYTLCVSDQSDHVITTLRDTDTASAEQLRELYRLARRDALNVDAVLRELLQELSALD